MYFNDDKALDAIDALPPEPPKPQPKWNGWSAPLRALPAAAAETLAGLSEAAVNIYETGRRGGAIRMAQRGESLLDVPGETEASRSLRNVADLYSPDPVTAGDAERVVFGLTRGIGKAVGYGLTTGPAAPFLFGADEGLTQMDQLQRQGVDTATAAKVGVVAAAVSTVGFMVPVAGKTVASTIALGAASGPASFIAQQASTREILRAANYQGIAEQFDPLDPAGLTVSMLPFGFGAWAMRGKFRPPLKAPNAATPARAGEPIPADAGRGNGDQRVLPDDGVVQGDARPADAAPVAGGPVVGDGPGRLPDAVATPHEAVDAAMVHNLTMAADADEAFRSPPMETLDEFAARVLPPSADAPARATPDPFLGWLKESGGVNFQDKFDITGESSGVRLNRGGVFKRDGLGLDELAVRAESEGWLPPGSTQDVDGGVPQIRDMLKRAMEGERLLPLSDQYQQVQRDQMATAESQRAEYLGNRLRMLGVDPEPARGNADVLQAYLDQHEPRLLRQAIAEQATTPPPGDASWVQQRDEVAAEFNQQLAALKGVSDEQAQKQAELIGSFYATMARRAGMGAKELAQKYPLRIQAEAAARGGQTLDQAKPIQTDTPEFKAWFGASKVVDADGKPLVVYHGTASDITVFDPSKTKAGDVIFTTPDPQGASVYAESRGSAANVMPLFVSIKNPVIINANDYSFDLLSAALTRGGADGVLVVDETGRIKIAAPFSAEQIKSATGNRGTFDPKSPNILEQFAGVNAKTANVNELTNARRRLAMGDDAETVRKDTGWSKGVDGRWRFEISDADAKLKPALASLETGGYEAKQIESITYRKVGDAYDVTLNPVNPQNTSDFVTLKQVSKDVLDAVLPDDARKAIDRGDGEADYIGNFEDAKRVDVAFPFEGFNALPLSQVVDHPALFAAYPKLADVMVQVQPGLGRGGSFAIMQDGQWVIRIGRGDQLSTLLHEIQHGIQEIEGFARGGSADQFKDKNVSAPRVSEINTEINALLDGNPDFGRLKREQNREFIRLMDAYGHEGKRGRGLNWDNVPERERDAYFARLDALEKFPENSQYIDLEMERRRLIGTPEVLSPQEQYTRLAGEVEARNTQARAAMTEAERAATAPSKTADVADSDVIVTFNGKEMASAPAPENASSYTPRAQISLGSADSPSIISIFENADASSVIHEAGHFFLEVQADLAKQIRAAMDAGDPMTKGERGIAEDMGRVLDWVGIKDEPGASALDRWLGMSVDEKRTAHEQFARGFEAYTREGKAPSAELVGVFQRFKDWLQQIYKDALGLNVKLTDEVRGVFDRMLATDQQIAAAGGADGQAAGTDAQPAAVAQPQTPGVDPLVQSIRTRGADVVAESPDLVVGTTEDGRPITAREALEQIKREAAEGSDTELGGQDAPLLDVAIRCALSQGQ